MAEEFKVVVMGLGKESYGVDVKHIKTIEKLLPITRIPNTPHFVKGVINLRGIVIPVLDTRARFGLEPKQSDNETRIVIVSHEDMEVGLIVDAASDVVNVNEDDIQNPPEITGGIKSKYVKGVVQQEDKDLLILLDVTAIFDKSDLSK